jgi:hypothetical protein
MTDEEKRLIEEVTRKMRGLAIANPQLLKLYKLNPTRLKKGARLRIKTVKRILSNLD